MTLTWIFFKPIVLAVLVAATQTISPVQPDERGRWGFPRTSSLEPVEHVIMGHRFRIPKAYLYLEEEWSPGVRGLKTHALMEGSLPDIAPYSRETAPLHKDYRSGTRQIVDFSLRGIKYGIGLRKKYFGPEYLEECRGNALTSGCARQLPTAMKYPSISTARKRSPSIAIRTERCRARAAGVPFPSSTTLLSRFGSQNPLCAPLIIAGVYEVVCDGLRFHVPDANTALTYNYCEKKVYHGTETND